MSTENPSQQTGQLHRLANAAPTPISDINELLDKLATTEDANNESRALGRVIATAAFGMVDCDTGYCADAGDIEIAMRLLLDKIDDVSDGLEEIEMATRGAVVPLIVSQPSPAETQHAGDAS